MRRRAPPCTWEGKMEIKITNRKGAFISPKEYAKQSGDTQDLHEAIRYALIGTGLGREWSPPFYPKSAGKKELAQDVELIDGVYIPKE